MRDRVECGLFGLDQHAGCMVSINPEPRTLPELKSEMVGFLDRGGPNMDDFGL